MILNFNTITANTCMCMCIYKYIYIPYLVTETGTKFQYETLWIHVSLSEVLKTMENELDLCGRLPHWFQSSLDFSPLSLGLRKTKEYKKNLM